MNTVNITLASSDYDKIKYPAGELQVRLSQESMARLADADAVRVVARISSAEQIMELILLWDAIGSVAPARAEKTAVLPYLPYARGDRRFIDGDCFGLGIFATMINAVSMPVVSLDVHSAQSARVIDNLTDVSALPLIAQAVVAFARKHDARRLTVLFPDEGARKRYSLPAILDGIAIDVLHCSKKRHPATGKLLGFHVPEANQFPTTGGQLNPVLLVDDICDGGGTFVGIADALKDLDLRFGLYVTHGIFAKGLEHLEARFEAIYTTDSFREWPPSPALQLLSAMPLLLRTQTREVSPA